jgi:hypothetical protein
LKNILIAIPLLLLASVWIYQSFRSEPTAPPVAKDSTDWKAIVAEIQSPALGGLVDESSAYGGYLRSLESMDGPGLMAALDRLKAADIPTSVWERLEPSVVGTLMRNFPELALEHLAPHIADPPGSISSQLFGTFRELAEKLPLKAATWLDRTTSAGIFGSVEEPLSVDGVPLRVTYERELIRALLACGSDQAELRLRGLPESWRSITLQGADSPQGQRAFASLVREFMSPDEQMREFSRMAASAAYHGGTDGITRLLDQVGATAEERETIIRETPVPPGSEGR